MIVSLVVVLVIMAIFGSQKMQSTNMNTNKTVQRVSDREKKEIQVGTKKIQVEIVTSPTSLTLGLSGRDSIGADGMLFVFDRKRVVSFWMKEMKFDIDMIFIADGKIEKISENVPRPTPGTKLEELPLYTSDVPVNAVLEIPAGEAAKMGLKTGDLVEVPLIK